MVVGEHWFGFSVVERHGLESSNVVQFPCLGSHEFRSWCAVKRAAGVGSYCPRRSRYGDGVECDGLRRSVGLGNPCQQWWFGVDELPGGNLR